MMNQKELDEQRFQSWLERLEKSLQDVGNDGPNSPRWSLSHDERAALLDTIKTTTIFDKESVPGWALRNERILSCLSSTSEELKNRLRRLSFPKMLNSFEQLKPQQNIVASLENVGIQPLRRENNRDYGIVNSFFEDLDKNPTDVVVGICKLADYGSRFTYLKDSDESYISKLVQHETRRQQTSDRELQVRHENLKYLERSDEEQLLESSLVQFKEHLGQLRHDLTAAEAEEEAAKKVYEAAMLKVKKSKESVEKFETFVDVVGTQSEVLSKVNTIKIQLDTFNKASAANRLNMLGSLQNAFSAIQSKVMQQRMSQDFPILLQNLNEIFRNMISSAEYSAKPNSELTAALSDQPVSIYCAVRIGLETLNLWRRLVNVSPIQPFVENHLLEFSQFLTNVSDRLPDAPAVGIDSSDQFVDSTVVLYFNHIFHDTPGSHIENQSRTDSCIKLLMKKVNSQVRNHHLLQGSSSNSSIMKQLVLEKCNEILSPPLWCLPLVHGPQYLTQLWRFSEEAADEDLYVPLEFDTEWETDDEGLGDDVDEHVLVDSLWKKRKNTSHASLVASLEVEETAKSKLGMEKAQKLELVLTPRFGDTLIARALKKNTQKSSNSNVEADGVGNRHSKRFVKMEKEDVDDSSDDSNEEQGLEVEASAKSLSKPSNYSSRIGKRVRTPYGSGTLLDPLGPDEERKPGRIVRVKLDWGATGYLNTEVIYRARRQRSMQPRDFAKQKQQSSVRANSSSADVDRSNKDRFLHTNFTLHRIVRKILAHVKVQRLVLDRFGVKDAHLSLWIHGRTSKGITQNIENGMLNWMSKYDRKVLEKFLDDREELMKQCAPEVFMTELELGMSFMKALDAMKQSDVAQPENVKNYFQDPSESREKLIEEGFAYSAQRLIKKSGEMRAKTVKTKRKSKYENNPPTENISSSSSLLSKPVAKQASGPVHRLLQLASTSSSDPVTMHTTSSPLPVIASVTRSPWKARSPRGKEESLFSEEDGERVRVLLHKVNHFLNVSQTWFATELHRRYGVKTSQTTISAWTRNKASSVSSKLLDICVLKWIDHHRRLLSQSHLAQWEELSEKYKYVLDTQDTIFDKTQNDVEGNVNDVSEDEEGIDGPEEKKIENIDVKSSPEDSHPMDVVMEEEDVVDAMEQDDKAKEIVSSDDENPTGAATTVDADIGISHVCQSMDLDETPINYKDVVKAEEEDMESGSEDLISESEHDEEHDDFVNDVGGNEDSRDPDFGLLMKELKRLWKLFSAEQNRRSLTHSYISQEATRLGLKLPQPSISKFYRDRIFPFVNRAREFLNHISRWMAYSRTKAVDDIVQSQHICSGCGVHRAKFGNQKDFLNHIGTCSGESDIIPLEATIDKYSAAGRLNVFELSEEQPIVESYVQKLTSENSQTLFRESLYNDACYICSAKEDITTCSVCKKRYHVTCVTNTGSSPGDNELCTACKRSIRLSHYHGSSNDISVGKYVLAPNHALGILQDAVCLHKMMFQGHEVVLFKFFPSPDESNSLERDNIYQWSQLRKNQIFVLKPEGDGLWRRRAGRRPGTTKKRTANEMEDGDEDEEGEEGLENPYSRRTRPRHAAEDSIGQRVGNSGRRASAGRGRGRQQQQQQQLDTTPPAHTKNEKAPEPTAEEVMTDTYLSANSLKAALCAAGTACRAVDIVMTNRDSNVFVCTRPPGHHAGRYGLTRGCLGTGFCLLNNAAIALTYARIRWGLERIAIVDIDVHFGNGTADILKGDTQAFFASVHMIYGQKNDGVLTEQGGSNAVASGSTKDRRNDCVCGFFPSELGATSITDNFISVGVFPENLERVKNRRQRRRRRRSSVGENEEEDEDDDFEDMEIQKPSPQLRVTGNNYVGSKGFVKALKEVVIPRMENYKPQLLIISAGFDGFLSDPLGGEMGLTLEDYTFCTNLLTTSMKNIEKVCGDQRSGRVISLLEGGYDTSNETLGLAKCVDAHVAALRGKNI